MHWRAFVLLPGGSKLSAYVINISDAGLSLISPRTFTAGEAVEIAVGVPNPDDPGKLLIAKLGGSVRYSVLSGEHFQIGVNLTRISDADKRHIAAATRPR